MVKKYKTINNWESKNFDTNIDVRSPSEFANDHIIVAIKSPGLSDHETEKVGTIYKKESTFKAKIIGSSLTARNIADHIEKKFLEQKGSWQPLIYCWRGGMRSSAFAWLARTIGVKTYLLKGGYKSYRKWVLNQFETDLPIRLIGGKTGTRKTDLLNHINKENIHVIDLEGIANHRGSSFGSLGMGKQPSTQQFENVLAESLNEFKKNNAIINARGITL